MVPASLLEKDEQVAQAVGAGVGMHTVTKEQNGHREKARVQVQIERPNIFVLYEQNIGLLTPMIASQLEDAADHYPADWIEAAFNEAVQRNKRNWKYINAILRRWETEGR